MYKQKNKQEYKREHPILILENKSHILDNIFYNSLALHTLFDARNKIV